MEGLREIFTGEAQEILQNLEPEIVNLEETKSSDAVNKIFRSVHTLKGSSGMAGLMELSEFTHRLENLMDAVRGGSLQVDGDLIDILLNSMDWIRMNISGNENSDVTETLKTQLLSQIDAYMQNGNLPGKDNVPVYNSLSAIDSEIITNNVPFKFSAVKNKDEIGYRFYRIKVVFKESVFRNGIDPLMIIDDLVSLGRISRRVVDKRKLPDFENLDPEKCFLSWDIIMRTDQDISKIEETFIFVRDHSNIKIKDITETFNAPQDLEVQKLGEIMLSKNIINKQELEKVLDTQKQSGKKIAELMIEKGYASDEDVKIALEEQDKIKKKIESSSIRVSTGKLDKLLNLLGEIVIGQSAIMRAAESIEGNEAERVVSAVNGLDRTTREFQENLMGIRMIPIGPTFEQFRRFVRDTAKTFNKDIKLVIEGAETELDKTVIEKLNDPLKHMIRNSIDHGIESTEDRKKLGKNLNAEIVLKAYHQEGSVYVEVKDDGRGIDKSKVRKKAEQLGFIKHSEEISDDNLFSFLFTPGFSTAEKVGDLSGRGVGMDVVKTNIDELRGTIKIESEKGRGTVFTIKLPLTLAIIDGMLVRVGVHKYVIPLLSIVESIRPAKNEVKTIKGQGEVVYIRGQYVSLIRLYEMFGIKSEYTDPCSSLVVIVESNSGLLALMVDELIGQQQIVIKSMDSELTKNRAISGASILGDGKIALILDIHGLAGDVIH